MHTVCRFCHYSSQVDRYAQFVRAYCVLLQPMLIEPRHKKLTTVFEESNQRVGVLDILCKKLAKKGNILLEQTAQALIRLHR